MPLPDKVQTARDLLVPYCVAEKLIMPPLYRWYLRYEPSTPPPLWDATPGYWVAYAVQIALVVGCTVTAFAVWFMGLAHDPATLQTAQRVFFVSQVIGWTAAGFIAWVSTAQTRAQCLHVRQEIGLPAWEHFHAGWHPSLARLQQRAAPERYWLRALHGKPLFVRAQVAGVFAFAALAWLIPNDVAKVSMGLAMVYLLIASIGVQRTTMGMALPRDAHLWTAGHGLMGGALLAALVWNVIVAQIMDLPREPVFFAFALLSLLMHAWEFLMFEQDKGRALRAEAAEQARQLAEARLHALSAQIEPHFIFNTIAHLKSMIANDPAAAEQMADELSDFLRASLYALRGGSATVAREMDLIRAYLNIARLRLGARLVTDVHMDARAAGVQLPSHLLLTLVENAVQHGIEPKTGPGRIAVGATCAERDSAWRLVLRVEDDGAGFGATGANTSGTGVGLANVRERLAAAFGPTANFRLLQNAPSGVIAEIDLPLPNAPATSPGQTPGQTP
ncbi:MAG: histidine kinase [Betaproteobacteria bacterium]|nr:histidine kinase [Betaproteobacteria bacterium]